MLEMKLLSARSCFFELRVPFSMLKVCCWNFSGEIGPGLCFKLQVVWIVWKPRCSFKVMVLTFSSLVPPLLHSFWCFHLEPLIMILQRELGSVELMKVGEKVANPTGGSVELRRGVSWANGGGVSWERGNKILCYHEYPPSSPPPHPTPPNLSYERTSQNLRRTFCQPWTLCIVGCPRVKTIAVSYLNNAYWLHDPYWLPTYPWEAALPWRSLLTTHIPLGSCLTLTILTDYPHTLGELPYPDDPYWLPSYPWGAALPWRSLLTTLIPLGSCLTLRILTDYPHTLGELPYPEDPYWLPSYPWGAALPWRSLLTTLIPLGSCLTLTILTDYPHTLGELPYPDDPYWPPTYPWGAALPWRSLLTTSIPLGSCLTLTILTDHPHNLGELPYPDDPHWLPAHPFVSSSPQSTCVVCRMISFCPSVNISNSH